MVFRSSFLLPNEKADDSDSYRMSSSLMFFLLVLKQFDSNMFGHQLKVFVACKQCHAMILGVLCDNQIWNPDFVDAVSYAVNLIFNYSHPMNIRKRPVESPVCNGD